MEKITAKELLINQKNPDRSDSNYVDFWLKHINRCKSGVIIGGVKISGWLYWHLNFFKVGIDQKDDYGNSIRPIINPYLRDNEWMFNWAYEDSKNNKMLPIIAFGTRRFAKSVIISSLTTHNAFIFQNSNPLIIGGSQPDINNITKYIDDFYENRPDCFSDFIKTGDWSKTSSADVKIEFNKRIVTANKTPINPISYEFFPIKDKPTDRKFSWSQFSVRNLEHGSVLQKDQILAGITPTMSILDECGKFDYSAQRSALLPAIQDIEGNPRFVELLVGTGGNTDLSTSAEEDFLNTDISGFYHFDIEHYLKEVNEKYFKYVQNNDNKVGLFVPAEMSFAGGKKIEIPLYEYLKRDFTEKEKKDLEGLTIQVTDWSTAKEKIVENIEKEKKKSKQKGNKAQMYYPFQPEDCFLHVGNNPFPVEEARKTQRLLKEKGLTGEHVHLTMNSNGTVSINSTTKEIIEEYPFKGGTHDAPLVIYERPIYDNHNLIKNGTYVAGFDGYKIASSDTTDSVGVLYIFKRKIGITGYQHQLVASIATRPNRDEIFYRQVMLALIMYNAECLPERDTNLYKYLQSQNKVNLLADCKNLAVGITPNTRAETLYGLPATPQNKEYYMKLVQKYCNDEIILGYTDDDEPIIGLGIERITDIMLLQEIIKFGKLKNYDRIIAFGHALAWDAELTTNNILPDDNEDESSEFDINKVINIQKYRKQSYRH